MMNSQIERLYPSLTPEQWQVISHISGPLRVLAGPGSGKSLTLILRAINLLLSGHARPQDITISTFSRNAARELSDRFATVNRDLGGDPDWLDTQITTTHGFCQKLLRERGSHIISPAFTLLDDLGRLAFIDSRLHEISNKAERGELFRYWRSPADAVRGLTRAFDQIVDLSVDPCALVSAENGLHSAIGRVYLEYERALKGAGVADFSHLLRWAHDLLADAEMGQIPEQCYALVDEFQDTNRLQEQIFRLWTARSHNLMVVGDDDQSIYGFRGARPNNLATFPNRVAGCKTINLATNFRSHDGIVAASANWMREVCGGGAVGESAENLPPAAAREVLGNYPSVVAVDGRNPQDEADQLALLFSNLKRDAVVADYDQIALLLHSVRDDVILPYTDAFRTRGIPYSVRRQERLFDRPEVRRMIGCLAITFDALPESSHGPNKMVTPFHSYLRSATKAVRASTPRDSALYRALVRWPAQIRDAVRSGENLHRSLHDYVYALLSIPPFAAAQQNPLSAKYFALWSRCVEAFHAHYGYRQISGEQVVGLRRAFFDTFCPLVYLEPGWQCVDADSEAAGQVQIMTVHQSKGREFPVVAVGSLAHDPGIRKAGLDLSAYAPDHKATAGEAPDTLEPARCKYTAFTRAKDLLVLTGRGKPSPTLSNLWRSLPRWSGRTHRALSRKTFPLQRPSPARPFYSVTGDVVRYERCPRQFMYFRKYGFADPPTRTSIIGNIVHGSIDAIHRDALRGASVDEQCVRQTVTAQSKVWAKLLASDQNQESVRVAFQQVARYAADNQRAFGSIVASEIPLRTDEGDYLLTGMADLISDDGGALEITDFKAGERAATTPERSLEYERQLMLYAHMAGQRFGRPVSRARIYWTAEPNREQAVQSLEVKADRIAEARAKSALTVESIGAGDFTVQAPPPQGVCNSCALRTLCRRDGTINPT